MASHALPTRLVRTRKGHQLRLDFGKRFGDVEGERNALRQLHAVGEVDQEGIESDPGHAHGLAPAPAEQARREGRAAASGGARAVEVGDLDVIQDQHELVVQVVRDARCCGTQVGKRFVGHQFVPGLIVGDAIVNSTPPPRQVIENGREINFRDL